MDRVPLQKSHLWYKIKNPWPWDKTTLFHLVVFARGPLNLWPREILATKLHHKILWFLSHGLGFMLYYVMSSVYYYQLQHVEGEEGIYII